MDIVVRKYHESKGHRSPVYGLSMYADGSILSAGGEGWIASWNIDEPENGRLIATTDASVFCLAYHPGYSMILAGDRLGVLYFIDHSGNVTRKLAHKGEVYGVFPVGKYLYSIGNDGWLVQWNIVSGEAIYSLQLSHRPLRSFVCSQDGTTAYVGDGNGVIHCVDLQNQLVRFSFPAHDGTVFSLELQGDNMLMSGGKDAQLKLWQAGDALQLVQFHPAHWFSIYSIRKHPDIPLVATASRDKQIRLWNADTLDPILTIDYGRYQGHIRSVNNLLWTTDGKYLVSAGDDATIIFWEFEHFL